MSLIKVLTVGDGQVGKTSLLRLLSDTKMPNNEVGLKRTIIFDFHHLKFDDKCETIFFDIAGQENEGMEMAIKGMTRFVLGGVNLIFFMFDVNKLESLLNIAKWYKTVNSLYIENAIDQPKIIIIGNKCDLESNISQDMIDRLLDTNDDFVKYMETSCVTKHGVPELSTLIHSFIHEGRVI